MDTTTPWTPVRWAGNGPVRLAYDRFTEGADGEPLLLVIGLGVSRRWWPDGLCRALAARGFAVARYDQRDAGESTHLPRESAGGPIGALLRRREQPYTAEDMTDDAVAVLDALGWGSAHLFGASLGGAVAQRTAVRHPGRVRTLTSVSAVPGDAAGLAALRYVRLRTLVRLARVKHPDTPEGDVAAGVEVARILASPGRPFDEAAARELITGLADPGVRDTTAQGGQIGARWRGPAIDTIAVPTLVLHGADDPLIKPSAGRRVAARVPGARLALLPGMGHDLPEDVWDDIAARVRHLADQRRTPA
ncbi:alpha/beta hydrolase [Actinomadura kijaniata]|uniref:Pimeloyl-ACP methyl ester carboxylesterase n=1 Tax=Actinomadura namibiensis TaxID=182080 RepID=A0A7W3LUE2_ACTNM|nr:alpha/beta hydrolase [Actinomadura namibiensis]MBA8954498.1 pimeloyl-ACP methyl ester carboxylesterase [Actinomadura namibiensis]